MDAKRAICIFAHFSTYSQIDMRNLAERGSFYEFPRLLWKLLIAFFFVCASVVLFLAGLLGAIWRLTAVSVAAEALNSARVRTRWVPRFKSKGHRHGLSKKVSERTPTSIFCGAASRYIGV